MSADFEYFLNFEQKVEQRISKNEQIQKSFERAERFGRFDDEG